MTTSAAPSAGWNHTEMGQVCRVGDDLTGENLDSKEAWKPGKTECLLQYRGHGASKRLEARRIGPDGRLVVRVPKSDASINVVESYKHLGGIVTRDGGLVPDAASKKQSALAAYMPIAMKVFASSRLALLLKLSCGH